MDTTSKRPLTPAESLAESLKQMNLIREGKLPKKTWKQVRKAVLFSEMSEKARIETIEALRDE